MKGSIGNFLFIIAGGLGALVVAELVLGLHPFISFPLGVPRSSTWISFPEHPKGKIFVSFDKDGNRTEGKSGRDRTLMIVGDSHVFGVGVGQDALASTILSHTLEPKGYEVINISRMGTSLVQYFSLLKSFEKFQPEVIVLLFYSGNDIISHLSDREAGKMLGDPYPYLQNSSSGVKQYFSRYHLYHLLAGAKSLWHPARSKQKSLPQYFSARVQAFDQAEFFLEQPEKASEVMFYLAKDFERLKEEFSNTRTVIVGVIPSALQVAQESDLKFWKKAAKDKKHSFEELQKMDYVLLSELLELTRKSFQHHLDLLPALRAAAKESPVYYTKDCHLNERGHRVLSDEIAMAVERIDKAHNFSPHTFPEATS